MYVKKNQQNMVEKDPLLGVLTIFKQALEKLKQNRAVNRLIYAEGKQPAGGLPADWGKEHLMEQTNTAENLWRVWVDTRRRIVSFHEEEGSRLLEFRNRDMFFSCIEQYTGKQYRYQ